MKTFDAIALKILRADIGAALATVEKTHGIKLSFNSISYKAEEFSTRLMGSIQKSPAVAAKAAADEFGDWAAESGTGLTKEHFGKQFPFQGKTYTISGINARSKYAVVAKSPTGTTYRLLASDVAKALGIKGKTRAESDILSDINNVYNRLSPESLSCDGEASHSSIAREHSRLQANLRKLFAELGREVSEEESLDWSTKIVKAA